jgi:hypothetical protein
MNASIARKPASRIALSLYVDPCKVPRAPNTRNDAGHGDITAARIAATPVRTNLGK